MHSHLRDCRLTALILLTSMAGHGATVSILDFADGQLPSSHGYTYVSAAVPEASAFSVAGGVLTMNTFGQPASGAIYSLPNAFDASLNFRWDLRLLVIAGGGQTAGAGFQLSDGTNTVDVQFGTTSLRINSVFNAGTLVPFITTNAFHDYSIQGDAGTQTLNVYADGSLLFTGPYVVGAFPSARLAFGDGSPGADGHWQLDFFSYINDVPAIRKELQSTV
jgi:hypothetical protein